MAEHKLPRHVSIYPTSTTFPNLHRITSSKKKAINKTTYQGIDNQHHKSLISIPLNMPDEAKEQVKEQYVTPLQLTSSPYKSITSPYPAKSRHDPQLTERFFLFAHTDSNPAPKRRSPRATSSASEGQRK